MRRWGVAVAAAALLGASSGAALAQSRIPRTIAYVDALKGTEDAAELRSPVAVAAASAEEIAVADAHGARVFRFRKIGVSWQLAGHVTLSAVPVGLAWDGERYVVSLRGDGGLVALEGEALLQRRLPQPRGLVPGPLAALPDGDLLVYDYAGQRVLRVSGQGEPAAIPGQVTGLAATPTGGFLVSIGPEARVIAFDANGAVRDTWVLPEHDGVPAWPAGLVAEPGGDLIVVDRHSGRLLVLDVTGALVGMGSRRGWEPGLLMHPAGIALLPDGVLVVADQGSGRAQVFRRTK